MATHQPLLSSARTSPEFRPRFSPTCLSRRLTVHYQFRISLRRCSYRYAYQIRRKPSYTDSVSNRHVAATRFTQRSPWLTRIGRRGKRVISESLSTPSQLSNRFGRESEPTLYPCTSCRRLFSSPLTALKVHMLYQKPSKYNTHIHQTQLSQQRQSGTCSSPEATSPLVASD